MDSARKVKRGKSALETREKNLSVSSRQKSEKEKQTASPSLLTKQLFHQPGKNLKDLKELSEKTRLNGTENYRILRSKTPP